MTFTVRLIDAVGRTVDVRIKGARTESTACGLAVRRMIRETGRKWYAVYAV